MKRNYKFKNFFSASVGIEPLFSSYFTYTRHFSTSLNLREAHFIKNERNQDGNPSIDPWFITGFTDAEASFLVVFQKSSKAKNGFFISTRFKISLHVRDIEILEQFKAYFGAGSLQSSGKGRNSVDFVVKSREELIKRVLPHFDKYPLITQKRVDYELFKKILIIIDKGEHLSRSGFEEIISIRSSLNLGLPENLREQYPDIIPSNRPLVENSEIPHPQWIAGFTYFFYYFYF